jgi:hypothetical protein
LLLTIPAIWADYEAASYGFEKRSVAPLQGLNCPVFIGNDESQVISIRIFNSSERIISPVVKTVLSTPVLPDSKTEFVRLYPGEQVVLQRTVGPENIDLGRFIFVNAQMSTAYPLPDQENTCGIFVLPVAMHGSLVLILGVILSASFMAAGIFLLYQHGTFPGQLRLLVFLAVVTSLAMFVGFLGWWLQAILLVVVVIIASWSSISAAVLRS